ncbi:MAG: hypothetical protein EU533_01130 [Promethearchaeota archaeon]|nr:MAG: hypothetical protein EU533_01130 [Candidatus Lokiarchaeota archaeon]
MTSVRESEFINKLYEVVIKLSSISKAQGYRFKKEWDLNFNSFITKPHLIRNIIAEKDKFLTNIDYRISVLNNVRLAFEDCFHAIKSLLMVLYKEFLNESEMLLQNFNEQDQLILKYFIAYKVLGDLIQYNTMDHETIPIKFNLMARNYLMFKLKGLNDEEILENMKKIKIILSNEELQAVLNEIITDGFLMKSNDKSYSLKEELILSDEGAQQYNKLLRPLIDWPTGMWRSFYNIRELNVTVMDNGKEIDSLNKILQKSATQGYAACHYVFDNLIKYYEQEL